MYALCKLMVCDLSTKKPSREERERALSAAGINADGVLDRLSLELGVETDSGLSRAINVSKTTVSTWRSRNSIPYEHVIYLSLVGLVDLSYVLTGKGRFRRWTKRTDSIQNSNLELKITELIISKITPISSSYEDTHRAAKAFLVRRAKIEELVQNWAEQFAKTIAGARQPNVAEVAAGLLEKIIEESIDKESAEGRDAI